MQKFYTGSCILQDQQDLYLLLRSCQELDDSLHYTMESKHIAYMWRMEK